MLVTSSTGQVLAHVITEDEAFTRTTFVSSSDAPLQLGFIVYPQGGSIPRHVHRPVERRINGTSEFLWVRKGSCEVDIFDESRQFVTMVTLRAGDAILLLAGGHGFRMTADTVLAEVKQGPYFGVEEKERF